MHISFFLSSNHWPIFWKAFVIASFASSNFCPNHSEIAPQFIIATTTNAITATIPAIIATSGNIAMFNAVETAVSTPVTVAHMLYAVLNTPIATAIPNIISATIGFSTNHLKTSTNPLNISRANVPIFSPTVDKASIKGCQSISAIFSDITLNLSEQLFNQFWKPSLCTTLFIAPNKLLKALAKFCTIASPLPL